MIKKEWLPKKTDNCIKLHEFENLKIAYKIYNDKCKETILMFYGFNGCIDSMVEYFAPYLAVNYKVIVFDYPGHGHSYPVEKFCMQTFIRAIYGLIKKLKIGSLNLLGYSFGGIFALEFYKSYKPVIKTFILLHSKHFFADNLYNKVKFKALEILLNVNFSFAMKKIALPYLFDVHFTREQIDMANYVVTSNHFESVLDIYRNLINKNCIEILKMIDSPCLIIGSRKDPLVSINSCKYLNSRIQNSELIILDEYGHLSIISGAEPVALIILNYLEKAK